MMAFTLMGYAAIKYFYSKDGPLLEAQVFSVPNGAGLSQIASKLENEGIITDDLVFKLVVKIEEDETAMKAGEYEIPPAADMGEVYEILKEGKAILYPVTVPEGLTSAQIVRLINAAPNLSGEITEIPREGTLLPETYLNPRGMDRQALIEKMRRAQKELIDRLWDSRAERIKAHIKTPQDAITLASVVEKETGASSERPEVAGVFYNRLDRGIRLESDPTIIYGISQGEPLGRGLRRSEIDRKTDWNTYQIDGLPITPICNPGRAAIEAVINPVDTDYLFFVANGEGGHAFARTNREHERNVRKWREIEREIRARQRQGQ